MAAEKVTTIVLNVDLQCPECYRKIKKTLCKVPQIRDQIYDEEKNTVAITVVSCNPEKIRDKLSRNGGKVIKSIEIIEPEKEEEAEKPKQSEKPNKADNSKPNGKVDKPKADGEPPAEEPKEAAKAEPAVMTSPDEQPNGPEPVPADGVSSVFPYSGPSYSPYAAGPYYHGYGFPPPRAQPCYEGYEYGHGHGGVAHVDTCDYFSEENPQACTVM